MLATCSWLLTNPVRFRRRFDSCHQSKMQPVDGFTVEFENDSVVFILSNRYGESDTYLFPVEDARVLGEALLEISKQNS